MKRIVIACSKPTEQERLRAMLMRNGYTVVAEASNGMAALKSIRVTSPDIVLLEDRLPVVDGMQVAKILTEENLAPTIIIVSKENLDFIERAKDVATAFILRPYMEEQLYAAIETAIASHQRLSQLQQQINELQDSLKARKMIEQAKGLLMTKKGFSEAQSYKAIQQLAMKRRTSMKTVAEAILNTYNANV